MVRVPVPALMMPCLLLGRLMGPVMIVWPAPWTVTTVLFVVIVNVLPTTSSAVSGVMSWVKVGMTPTVALPLTVISE